jgi:3-hydroxyanthranilate 3,4-dioxygenase
MLQMPIVDLRERARELGESGKRVTVLWQDSESIGFMARGREYRSEFHIDPSDEVMLMVRGEMRLHYRTPAGKEEVAVIPEGSTIFTPAGVPHSPRFPPDAFVLVLERKRRPGDIDRFQWFCPLPWTITARTSSRRPIGTSLTTSSTAPAGAAAP